MAETKQQTSIAPTLQSNEKRVILADTLAQYIQYEEEGVVKELHPTYEPAISSCFCEQMWYIHASKGKIWMP